MPIELVDQQFSGEFQGIDIMIDTHNISSSVPFFYDSESTMDCEWQGISAVNEFKNESRGRFFTKMEKLAVTEEKRRFYLRGY